MFEYLPGILFPLVVLASVVFLLFRLRLFSGDEISGKIPLLFGGIILVMAATWQAVTQLSGYNEWFLKSVYFYLDLAQFTLFLLGLILVVAGISLYADFWQTRKEEIEVREQKVSILDDLQHDAREPYQLLELLNISIKEIVAHLPECAGAVFLLNRSRRQFVLASAVGLTKQETATLEYYPLERNIVSQAIDLGDPLIAGGFDFIDRSGAVTRSRFNSCLVLPMISGTDKIGGIILFTEQERFFGNAEIRYLSPVAEWLAEKIKSARLSRELSLAKNDAERRQDKYLDLTSRFLSAVSAFSSHEAITAFCRSLAGLASSHSVHLFGLANGTLHFHGGSEPLEPMSESYKTALADALDRQKPLIVNQEAVTDEDRSYIAFSSLIFPLGGERTGDALLLRKESGPFKVDDSDLKAVEIYARLAALVLQQIDSRQLDISRRKGFQKILQLLRFDAGIPSKEDWSFFVHCLSDILPSQAAVVIFVRELNGSFTARDGFPTEPEDLAGLTVLPGEGDIGQAASSMEPTFIFGTSKISQRLEAYEAPNREAFRKLFEGKQSPVFVATCPLANVTEVVAVAAIFLFDIPESERGEWERLITLATGLYSARLTVRELLRRGEGVVASGADLPDNLDEVINRLNNYLSAVIGNAELASTGADVTERMKAHFTSIITEAERAADFLRHSLGQLKPDTGQHVGSRTDSGNINEVLNSILKTSHVSENLYMIGGKPREISASITPVESVELADEVIHKLANEALSRFASLAQDEDIVTISTYKRGQYVYLDISRHQKNFPSVEPVAGFGEYQPATEVLRYRPTDTFLQHIADKSCSYSFDRFSRSPSYLSFKFPVKRDTHTAYIVSPPKAKVLAIDDQPVILDLISAMCCSLGYDPVIAASGEEGIKVASESSFDIVLTDLAMPDMSGLEVARRIRQLRPHTPIVLVTGWEVNISRAELEAAGITEVLYKPFRIEQLTEIIQSAISPQALS
jgi:CheY-like chemotaxis protein